MEIVLAIAAKIAEYTVAPVGRQLGYIIYYKSNVDNLKTHVQKLEGSINGLQHSIDEAKRNGEEIEDYVQSWLNEANNTISEGNKLLNDHGHARVGCFNGSFPNLRSRHHLSRKAKKIAQGIPEMIAEGKFERISYRPLLPVTVPASSRGYEALHSRTSMLNDIIQALKDDNVYMIGVYGMGGVGKSSLINELASQVEQNGSFGAVVLATVTDSPDVEKIQLKMGEDLGMKFEGETKEGRARRLRARIKKEKSILVILDNLWKKLDLIEVGIPFGDEHKGCKLLLTSRDLNVLTSEMGTQKDFKLEILSQGESWRLFEKTAGDVVNEFNLKTTAIEVANRCAGLPLLIVTVANALKHKDLSIWKDALTQLAKVDHKGLTSKVYSAIELSYNYLESDELKSFFLLMGSLGKDYWTMELLIYGWGLDLYKDVDTLANARNRVNKLTNDLRASCLLLDGDMDWVEMHDVIYDVASSIASEVEPFFTIQRRGELKEWPKMDWLKMRRRMRLPWCYIQELPEKLECPNLEILVLNSKDNFLKVPDNFLFGMRKLKVLDLGGLDFCPFPPPSLCQLTNLKALYLCQCILEDISIVAKLTTLEILSLEESEIKELPIEIGQLSRLRWLGLTNCVSLRVIPTNIISRLTCLEELYMGNCFIQWEAEGSTNKTSNASLGELRPLRHLKALHLQIQDFSLLPRDFLVFRTLESYKILIGHGWKWNWYGYRNFQTRTVRLDQSTTKNIHLDQGVKSLWNTVEELYLANLMDIRNIINQLNREGFLQLKHLEIQNSADIQHIIDSTECVDSCQVFPNLETLVLENLSNMHQFCHGPLPVQSFTKLKVIKVRGCHVLKNLFSYPMVKDLPQLLQIEISECKSMTKIIAEPRPEDDEEIDKIVFPKLNFLTLECLPMLVSFYSMALTTDMEYKNCITEDTQSIPLALLDQKVEFPNLETMKLSFIDIQKIWDEKLLPHSCIGNLTNLTINSCSSLSYLFPFLVARELVKLKYLEITNCQMLEEIFVLDGKMGNLPLAMESLSSTEEVIFPNLETLVISNMDNLKSIWHNQLSPNSFCKLKKVEIKFCKKLLYVFPSQALTNKFQNLGTIIVTDCEALEVVFAIQGLNSGAGSYNQQAIQLRTLTLACLPMLNHVFPLSLAKELMQLQVLELKDCGVESIVAEDEMAEAPPRLVFKKLTSLIFWTLGKLRSFYPGMHTLDCPMLRKLDVYHCDELQLFMLKSQNYQEDVPPIVQCTPPLSFEKVISNIEELSLTSEDVTMITNAQHCDRDFYTVKALYLQCFHDESDKFPWHLLKKFTNLENLDVSCSSFTEIFPSESSDIEHGQKNMKLRSLKLVGLRNLECICKENSPTQPVLQNLDTLWVETCAGLVNIMTPSIATSFHKLRKLIIYGCDMIEEIVGSEDGDASETALMKLEFLQLQKLPRIESFCKGNYSFKFPLLNKVFVMECPVMETFCQGFISTPSLRKVFVDNGVWYWEGDLNTTVRKICMETNSKQD